MNRRDLLKGMTLLPLLGEVAEGSGASANTSEKPDRLEQAFQIRLKAARFERDLASASHISNGDEDLYETKIGSYSKGLPHNKMGEPELKAFRVFVDALNSGDPYHLDRIPLGGYAKLSNPQAAWCFDLIGPDCSQLPMIPAPKFNSPEQAGEMCELYWQALAADVPFAEYETSSLIQEACKDLSKLSEFHGPKSNGKVAPSGVFRADSAGCLIGPYVSQFLWRDIPFSPIRVPQKIRTAVPSIWYATKPEDWLALQNGGLSGVNQFDAQPRYIRSGRDLGEYVHRDFTYQAFVAAALMLFNMGAPPDGGNPYKYSRTQSGFVSFGPAYVYQLIAIVTSVALKSVWFHKWIVHRKLRPEEYAGRVHHQLSKNAQYPIHSELLNSAVLNKLSEKNGSWLLPLAYPEGCPLHPSYPAGHAAIAGACATVLKACFDENYIFPNPVVSSPDGLALTPYEGEPLTVGGELDKLASNIALGRDFAGVHWRSDSIEGIRIGEQAAIRVLQEMKFTGNELFTGFTLKKFNGEKIKI